MNIYGISLCALYFIDKLCFVFMIIYGYVHDVCLYDSKDYISLDLHHMEHNIGMIRWKYKPLRTGNVYEHNGLDLVRLNTVY